MYPELSFIAAFYYYKRHLFMHFILNCQDCWETGLYNATFKTIQQGCESTWVHSQAQKHTVCVLIMSVSQNLISHRLKRASGKPAVKLAAQTASIFGQMRCTPSARCSKVQNAVRSSQFPGRSWGWLMNWTHCVNLVNSQKPDFLFTFC